MFQRIKKPTMATTSHRAHSNAAVVARRELAALRNILRKTPHGDKTKIVKAFAQNHKTTMETIYRRMAALFGRVSRRKIRADAGLSKTPLLIVNRRIAFKKMACARKAQGVICAKTDELMRQAFQALSVCDQQAYIALRAELTQLIAEVEEAVRRLRAYESRFATPINTNVDAVSTQTTGV